MPAYDEPEDVRRLALASVVANRASELIAVVDGGDLAVARVAAEYCDRVLRIPKPGKPAAIAAGLRASDPETDVVVVLDWDTIWAPDARLQGGPAPGARRSNALVPVRIAAFATMLHQGWITRPDRADLSAVRSSLLPDEPAPEIFMAMQETTPREALHSLHRRRRPQRGAQAPRQPRRQLLRRRDAVVAPSPVPRVSSRGDTGGRSTPSP